VERIKLIDNREDIVDKQNNNEDTDNNDIDLEMQEEDLIDEIYENLKGARNHFVDWRKNAKLNYDFYAGNQWSEEDRTKLDAEQRPAVTFNRIARTINTVSGLELQNRQEIRAIPRRLANAPVSEIMTQAFKWARDNCDAEDEESQAFQDTLKCGYGWVETSINYENNQDGEIEIARVDPLEMYYDKNAKKNNLVDATWIARIKLVPMKEVKALWPDARISNNRSNWLDSETDADHLADEAYLYKHDQGGKSYDTKLVEVVHYQWYEKEPVYRTMTQTGQFDQQGQPQLKEIRLNQKKYEMAKEQNMFTHDVIKQVRRVYYQAFIIGKEFVERKSEIKCGSFTFKALTGMQDRNNNIFFGLVELMKDPQMWANKWLSQIQHILNTGAKSGVLAEQGAIPNPNKFESNYAKPGSISEVAPGALGQGKVQPKTPAPYPDGVDRLLQYAVTSINDVPGISLEMIGMTNRDQAAYLEQQRKNQGVTLLAIFFDSLRRYRKMQGRLLEHFIKEYIADGRLIRITGQEGAQFIPLVRDEMTFEYDIIVDDAPTSTNMKEKVFSFLTQLLPMILPAGIPIPEDFIDYAPLPESLIQKWKQKIANNKDPIQEQMKQLQLAMAKLEAEGKSIENQKSIIETQSESQKRDSEISLNYAKATQAQAIGQDEHMQAQQKMHGEAGDQMRNDRKIELENARKNVEMMLNHQRKIREANLNHTVNIVKARQSKRQSQQSAN
jgi:hypothetical protein